MVWSLGVIHTQFDDSYQKDGNPAGDSARETLDHGLFHGV
jgi:hypothetical protein